MQQLNVMYLNQDKTIKYASRELKKYLEEVSKKSIQMDVQYSSEYDPYAKNVIWLGTGEELDIDFAVDNTELDDGVYISIAEGKGVIAGTNPRSVLIGIYRFLTELGCRWIRPGKDGEFLVKEDLWEININLKEEASYRHRGIVIEGATSFENVIDTIEWAPKMGFNSFFMQFKEGYVFFERWYKHINNSTKEPEGFTIDMAVTFTQEVVKALKKRGMLYHAVGHGWTAEAMGVHDIGWEVKDFNFPEERKKDLALIDGERKLWYNVISNTNLCYSNPKVRKKMVEGIVNYLEKQGEEVDYLHFWLADGTNNHCECEECCKKRPSDLYIMMLNELDKALTGRKINTKIVFLAYLDLLWAPQNEEIKNSERFLFMFAPISRTFSKSYCIEEREITTKEYRRNKNIFPRKIGENLGYLKEWQKQYKGDSFVFDYPLGRAHFGEPGYYKLSQIIYEDIQCLQDLNLNGYLSCQELRAFFPTGLPNYVMGRTLWNKEQRFEDLVKDYFNHAFGSDWKLCVQYVRDISDHFSLDYYYNDIKGVNVELQKRFEKVEEIVDHFIPVIMRNQETDNMIWRQSWKYLKYHAHYCKLFGKVLAYRAAGEIENMKKAWDKLVVYLQESEDEIQRVYDVFRFIQLGKLHFIH